MNQYKTVAILIDYLDLSSFQDKSWLERTSSRIQDLIDHLSLPCVLVQGKNTQDIFSQILMKAQDYQNLLFFHTNMPFVFPSLAQKLLEVHTQSFVDYSFVEYIPWGCAPFALSYDLLSSIAKQISSTHYSPFLLEEFLKQDLNQYDIEILLSDGDYRFIKDHFLITDKRTYHLFTNIEQKKPTLNSLSEFLKETIDLFRTYPSFVEISLTEMTESKTLFQTPPIESPTELSIETLELFIPQIIYQNPHVSIQLSLQSADPLLYQHMDKVLEIIQAYPKTQFILETLGYNLEQYKKTILDLENLKIIIFISAVSEELYNQVHRQYNLKKMEDSAEEFLQKIPNRTYLQWVRMLENETELQLFLKRWSPYEKNIIISQYNSLSSYLPQRKVVDFAPLKRFPCFRLQRDLFFSAQATINLCSVDIFGTVSFPFTKDFHWEKVYQQLGQIYKQHYQGEYTGICKNCDYWYIFNL